MLFQYPFFFYFYIYNPFYRSNNIQKINKSIKHDKKKGSVNLCNLVEDLLIYHFRELSSFVFMSF